MIDSISNNYKNNIWNTMLSENEVEEDSLSIEDREEIETSISELLNIANSSTNYNEEEMIDSVINALDLTLNKYSEDDEFTNLLMEIKEEIINVASSDNSDDYVLLAEKIVNLVASGNNFPTNIVGLMLSVALILMELGLMEGAQRAAANDDYIKAKQALADFQFMMTDLNTRYNGAGTNASKLNGNADRINIDDPSDWYAWIDISKSPVDWDKAPIPGCFALNPHEAAAYKDRVDKALARYHKESGDIDGKNRDIWLKEQLNSAKDIFLNYTFGTSGYKETEVRYVVLRSPDGQEKHIPDDDLFKNAWLAMSDDEKNNLSGNFQNGDNIDKFINKIKDMHKDDPTFDISITDKKGDNWHSIKFKVKSTPSIRDTGMKFPFEYNNLPSSLKKIVDDLKLPKTSNGIIYIGKEELEKIAKRVSGDLTSVVFDNTISDFLNSSSDSMKTIPQMKAFNQWLETPIKTISSSQDDNNNKVLSINERVRSITTLIKDLLEKVRVQ
ncbi:MAG: hypothetical protein PHC75_06125 [Burkholderiales bacterium]|nr:hypothetical protein [Burkholderiales bacterium]